MRLEGYTSDVDPLSERGLGKIKLNEQTKSKIRKGTTQARKTNTILASQGSKAGTFDYFEISAKGNANFCVRGTYPGSGSRKASEVSMVFKNYFLAPRQVLQDHQWAGRGQEPRTLS